MTGLDGDGTGKGTIVSYIDPADGKKHNVVFNDYLNLYQGSADWPLQVVCNP
jgi:hypothetical protein